MKLRYALGLFSLIVTATIATHQGDLSTYFQQYYSHSAGRFFLRAITFDSVNLPDTGLSNNVVSSSLDPTSLGWVEELLIRFPELSWYANDHVRRTFEGNYKQPDFSWSKSLYNKVYPEFDRAILSLWCLRAFYNGSQEAWRFMIAPQETKEALTWESFQEIHNQLTYLIDNHPGLSKEEVLLSMETYLVLADCSKTPYAQAKAREWVNFSTDSKDFFQQTLLMCPQIYPSLKRLSYPCLELLRRTAFPLHMGHIRHLEGCPLTMRRLIDSKLLQHYPDDFQFFYLVDLCDSAAFLGQITVKGSLFLTEPMHQANLEAKHSCECTLQLDEHDAFMDYLAKRAQALGLDVSSKQDRVLTRIGAMLRFNDPQYGPMLRKAFSKLNIELQAQVLSQLDVRNHDPMKRTPNYIPAVLFNLLQNEKLGNNYQDRLDKTFILGLPFIASVLKDHRRTLRMRRADPRIPLNFNPVARKVADNPYILNHVRFQILEGNAIVID